MDGTEPSPPERPLSTGLRYALAAALDALSTIARFGLDEVIGRRQPFLFYFGAVIVSAWLLGTGPSVLSLVLAIVAAVYLFLVPRGTLWVDDPGDLIGLIVFTTVGAAIIAFSDANRAGRRRLEAELARRKRDQERIAEGARLAEYGRDIGVALAHAEALPEMLAACAGATVRHLDGAFARIWTLDDAGATLELQASAGMYTHTDGPHGRVPVGQLKIGQIAAERVSHLTNAVVGDPRISDQEWARREGMVAFAGYPLIVEGRLVGVLAMFARRRLSYAELHAMESVADEIAVGIERKRAEGRLARLNRELEDRVAERTAELERTNAELRATAARLEWSNRELQEFASVASHDLQEPLRKIQAFGDRLEAKFAADLGDVGRDYIGRMRNAAGRMRTLIDDLLAFSRVSTRAQPFVRLDLNQVAREVLSDLEARLAHSGGAVELGDLPTIDADPTQMRQLLQNLIGNALKFHRDGVPPVIRVRAEPLPDDEAVNGSAGAVRLLVMDNGIGFDEKYLDRIFNVFQRLHGRQEYEGTGMGLAICRKIVERHSGTITARSAPGEGATFVITLPTEQPEPTPIDEEETP